MYGGAFIPLLLLGKAFVLVILSFFVLLGASKAESERLKKFGRTLAVLMWILAAGIVIASLYISVTGKSGIIGSIGKGRRPFRKFAPYHHHRF